MPDGKPAAPPETATFRRHDLPVLARELLKTAGARRVWLFKGDLGSGKTTLIKHLCAALGVGGPTSSPTFSIVNHYPAPDGNPIYHIDCYRLKNSGEGLDIGLEEYLTSGHYCFIEWPEKIEQLLPDQAFVVELRKVDAETRQITYHA